MSHFEHVADHAGNFSLWLTFLVLDPCIGSKQAQQFAVDLVLDVEVLVLGVEFTAEVAEDP
jgi:hypothetical protein